MLFLGHKHDMEPGEWRSIPEYNHTKCLLNLDGKYFLQENICHHQGSLLRTGSGKDEKLVVCPYHACSWSHEGSPVSKGYVGYHTKVDFKNDRQLIMEPVHEWCGFLFDSELDCPEYPIAGNYELRESRVDVVKSDLIPIVEAAIDVEHIMTVHANEMDEINIADCKGIIWDVYQSSNVQKVPYDPCSGTEEWNRATAGKTFEYGAYWFAFYPNIILEWQPGTVFVMDIRPGPEGNTPVKVIKYHDISYNETVWQINNDVWDTVWKQDCDQNALTQAGYKTVTWKNLEPIKQHFRSWLKSRRIL